MFQWISQNTPIVILAIFLCFAMIEAMRGIFKSPHTGKEDAPLEIAITLLFAAVIYPGILLVVGYLAGQFTPDMKGMLSGLPLWAMFAILLLGDDLTQYWWHRISHTSVLWPLHRAHHSAPHMGVRVVYRNNAFFIHLSYVGNSAGGFGNSVRTAIPKRLCGANGVGELP